MAIEDRYSAAVGIDVKDINPRPASEVRVEATEERIELFTEIFAKLPPLKVIRDSDNVHWLVDGRHRFEAALRKGKRTIQCVVKNGSYIDAFGEAAKANDEHGLPASNADKRHRVQVALKHPEMSKMSARDLAEHCGVGRSFVMNLRNSGDHGGHLKNNEKVTGKDGKQYPATKPRKQRAAPKAGEPEATNGNVVTESTPLLGLPAEMDFHACKAQWEIDREKIRGLFHAWPETVRSYFWSQLSFLLDEFELMCPDVVRQNVDIPIRS